MYLYSSAQHRGRVRTRVGWMRHLLYHLYFSICKPICFVWMYLLECSQLLQHSFASPLHEWGTFRLQENLLLSRELRFHRQKSEESARYKAIIWRIAPPLWAARDSGAPCWWGQPQTHLCTLRNIVIGEIMKEYFVRNWNLTSQWAFSRRPARRRARQQAPQEPDRGVVMHAQNQNVPENVTFDDFHLIGNRTR